MPRVKELLNVVVNCEIWGRLRCNAASIGYRLRIRKAFIHRQRHAAVTQLLSSDKSASRTPHDVSSSGAQGARARPAATHMP